jgi:hypothetical protein
VPLAPNAVGLDVARSITSTGTGGSQVLSAMGTAAVHTTVLVPTIAAGLSLLSTSMPTDMGNAQRYGDSIINVVMATTGQELTKWAAAAAAARPAGLESLSACLPACCGS